MDFWNSSDAAIKAKNKKELLDFAFKVSSKIFEDDLEEKIIEVWNSLGFNEELKTSDIQACHRLDELSGASPTSPKKQLYDLWTENMPRCSTRKDSRLKMLTWVQQGFLKM